MSPQAKESCGLNLLDIQETAKYTSRHKKEVLIPVCIQDDTMIYNRHGGAPCRDKQISVRKK